PAGGGANVARAGVGVPERFGEQCLAAVEVVVDERRRDPGVHGDPRDPDAVDSLERNPPDRGAEDPLARARACPTLHFLPPVGKNCRLGRGGVAHDRETPPFRTGSRSARMRSANHATALSCTDSGPHSYPRVRSPCWTLSTRSMSSSRTSVLTRWLAHCAN